MSQLDLETIAKTYANLSDQELERVVTSHAEGIRPEVFEIIEGELKKRNLNPNLIKSAIVQNQNHTQEELAAYADLLRATACPFCGTTLQKLNGTTCFTVKSFIIFTTSNIETIIGCPDCLDEKSNAAIGLTATLGWWGIPWGLFRTPVYIYRNFLSRKQNRVEHPNDAMLSYTLANIGKIEALKNQQENLQ